MKYIFLLFTFFINSVVFAQTIPNLKSRANFIGNYQPTENQKKEIISYLKSLAEENKVEMAILVVDSTKPLTIEQYSLKVAEKWKIGKKTVNNGVILVVATKDKKGRIEVGRGLEGVLTDALTRKIQKEKMVPFFKKGEYYNGMLAVINEVKIQTKSETPKIQQELSKKEIKDESKSSFWILITFIGGLVLIIISTVFLHRKNKRIRLEEEKRMEELRRQWRNEYITNQRKYKPLQTTNINSKNNNLSSSQNFSSSDSINNMNAIVTSSVITSSLNNDEKKSIESPDSFSTGGDYGGGGSSSDW